MTETPPVVPEWQIHLVDDDAAFRRSLVFLLESMGWEVTGHASGPEFLAACPQPDGKFVPPRAQSAHQMATQACKNILAKLEGGEMKPYLYHDHGSLVSLSRFSTVGSLMGNLMRGSMMVEGYIARMVYISLYRMHQVALHGYIKTGLIMLVGRINRVLRPTLKLH